jgi:flagellin
MGLRINHNIASLNTHRQLVTNDRALSRSLERLSSGMKINRAADGPASLIISEQMRAQIAGLKQAVDNSETAISMVQTSESALTEVSNLLTNMKQLSIHAANEGANDENMLRADQLEFENSLNTVDRITAEAAFGKKRLLDGTQAANGVGIGQGLEFIKASPDTMSSPVDGYKVVVKDLATQATIKGTTALTQEIVNKGEEVTISENGKVVSFVTRKNDSVEATLGRLRNEIKANGLDVTLDTNEDGTIGMHHNQFGSEFTLSVSSATAGLLSAESRVMQGAVPGKDIQGTIGDEVAFGRGQVLTGGAGTKVQGLAVRYYGGTITPPDSGEDAAIAGRVAVYQNSLIFQVGAQAGQSVSVSLTNTNTRVLGRGVNNESGYRNIRDVNIQTPQGATDSLKLIEKAIDDITTNRAELGAFQKNTLESNLRQLRINVEELTNAESVIRDSDMAQEIAEFTRNSIMTQAATAMLAQANQTPKTVLSLLG